MEMTPLLWPHSSQGKWELPCGLSEVKDFQQINTNPTQHSHRGHRGGVGQAGTLLVGLMGFLLVLAASQILYSPILGKLLPISVLSLQSRDTDISLL